MFHRVKVRKEDVNSQRFLWRGMDRHRDPDVMEMGVLIFGAACSPACAQEVKNLNAEDFREQYPDGVKAIIEHHYVDDYLDSVDSTEKAIQMFKEEREIHLKGGFDICNWISNSKELLAVIPEHLHAPSVKNMDFDGDAERVLGLFWKTDSDQSTFSMTFLKINQEIVSQQRLPTKRELLALVMSIYDPLGFLSLFTVKAKVILQETWRTGIGWDDEIPGSLQAKWERWNEELTRISTFRIPRCYSPHFSSAQEIQLHVFGDASEQAFGAVAYFRIQTENSITVSFVMAKAKVTPTKHLTIPRLELQAAVLGSRLATFIKAQHNVQISQTFYRSDSWTVISWLRADGKRFQQFVASRVGEIQEATEVSEWRWLSTKENVADEMTRDGQPSDWTRSSRWLNGPEFLSTEVINWPQEPINNNKVPEEDLELKKEFVCSVVDHRPLIDINRFSSCSRVTRTMAYVFRFIHNCRFPKERTVRGELIPEEVQKAKTWWWKSSQMESFKEEIRCLQDKKPLPSNSRLFNLNAVLEEDGILRIHGRLDQAGIPVHTRRPVLLDPKHPYTQLLISEYHRNSGHHGQEKAVNELKKRYHIINIRAAVRKSWKDCQRCKIERAQPRVPQMGQLPPVRLESHVIPFQNTGLDYFGPLSVTVGRRNEKRWGVLFTCLSTRAVHVEVASSLSTDSCILAIRRFTARRGYPSNLYSDNGTNFVGANNELNKSLKAFDQQQLTNECTSRGITWHFIPPQAPHMGGSWKRLVKSIKVSLYAVLRERQPKDEVLSTLLTEAEHIVNSHPLTHVPVDPDDLEALTPNHFLIGRSSNDQVPGTFDAVDLCLRKQWRQAQQLANNFWRRWVQEYLPTLLRRTKWFQQTKPIKLGDVVILVDNQQPRNSWPKGRVVKLYPGEDGICRVVDVQSATGIYKRIVAKLCILDVEHIKKDDNKPDDQRDGSEILV